MDKSSVLFIGGDERQIYCAKCLYDAGYEVAVFGFEAYDALPGELLVYTNLKIAILFADIIILPTPLMLGEKFFAPYSKGDIEIEKLQEYITKDKIVFGGKYSANFSAALTQKNILRFDFLSDESVLVQNAYLTAEGTIELMMRKTEKALFQRKVLIIGFGRIAKALVRLLQPFKMQICICARKKSDLTLAKLFGCRTKNLYTFNDFQDFDYIINTVPQCVLKKAAVCEYTGTFIDLACDYGIQNEHYILAKGIPGKYAAESAGTILAESVIFHLMEVTHE